MDHESCGLCGGDGRIANSLGRSTATCPGCHGSGRKGEAGSRFRDVTKTKPSHHVRPPSAGGSNGIDNTPKGPKVPTTPEGTQLASEVTTSTVLADDAKSRLVAEIVNHESTHGRCTQTFIKKVRKQARPAAK